MDRGVTMALMQTGNVLAIVQAGGAGGRMDVLTLERAKPALPFAGSYQLLDFPLSNLVNSRIDDVWLSVQYQASALGEQVLNGRPWDLDRTRGGLRLLVPQQGSGSMDEEGFAKGNADELFRLRDQIRTAAPDLVIVMSADHVYRLDYRDVIHTHRKKGAEVTVVTTDLAEVFAEDARQHAVVEVNRLGRVTSFAYKPDKATSTTVATEVFVYQPDLLIQVLEELHHEASDEPHEGDDNVGDSGLGDFGDLLLPRFVDRGKVYAHDLGGYWRDLGQPHHYLNAHLEAAPRRLRRVLQGMAHPHPTAPARAGQGSRGCRHQRCPAQSRLRRGRHRGPQRAWSGSRGRGRGRGRGERGPPRHHGPGRRHSDPLDRRQPLRAVRREHGSAMARWRSTTPRPSRSSAGSARSARPFSPVRGSPPAPPPRASWERYR